MTMIAALIVSLIVAYILLTILFQSGATFKEMMKNEKMENFSRKGHD